MSDPNLPPSEPPAWDAPPAAPTAPPPPPAGAMSPVAANAGGLPGFLMPNFLVDAGTPAPAGWAPKQKMIAGILGILVGSIGVHSFYLGNSKKGIIQIVATVVTCGALGLWGFIEGILILVGKVEADAYGVPLTE